MRKESGQPKSSGKVGQKSSKLKTRTLKDLTPNARRVKGVVGGAARGNGYYSCG